MSLRQSESIPRLRGGKRESRTRTIIGCHAKFVESPAVIAAEALEKRVGEATILRGAVGQLVTGKVIQTVWNKHIFVNVERRCDSLRKHVSYIVIRITSIVKLRAEGALPFLGLDHIVRVGRVLNESLEL